MTPPNDTSNKNPRKRLLIALGVVMLVALIPSFYYLIQQWKENRIVYGYIHEHGFDELPANKESAIKVSEQVIADFNVDLSTFKVLRMDDRPFLREDAGFLLTCREGVCGEGARVIVRLLNAMGYDATRVTLYDRYMQFAHTLVSVQEGDRSYWIDSINSNDTLTVLLTKRDISEKSFNYLNYSDKISDRLDAIQYHRDVQEADELKILLDRYFLYSFEAIPVTKLLAKIGINWRVFNLRRPPHFISVLAEEPHMVMFWFYFFIAVAITILAIWPLKKLLRNRS